VRVLVAMSGGVDSSVAAARLVAAGHDVVGVTMRLWGGDSDTGCCSVSDVDDARRVAQQLGIDHHVFNFAEAFETNVVAPYVADHAAGRTPNPCIECNRHLKFDALLRRAEAIGFDVVATGHHARVVERADGTRRVGRGADEAKDQSYVLHVLDQAALARVVFPLGTSTKEDVRREAADLGLRTAAKAESQDVCFITRTAGRAAFLRRRIPLHEGEVVDADGSTLGRVPAVELVTVGQRKGLVAGVDSRPRFALAVDVPARRVLVGTADASLVDEVHVEDVTWVPGAPRIGLVAQVSAHGRPEPVEVVAGAPGGSARGVVRLRWHEPQRRVAPGQSVVLYDGDEVVAGGLAR
jgi:tRNA-specific 2-thiouridylase